MKKPFILIILAIIAFSGCGLISPQVTPEANKERKEGHFDVSRSNDMQIIYDALTLYNTTEGQYPFDLIELRDNGLLNRIPLDPETGKDYDYRTSLDQSEFCLSVQMTNDSAAMENDDGSDPKMYERGTGC